MRLRWFVSSKVRQTSDLCKHVRKLRNAQRDILPSAAFQAIDAALQETEAALRSNAKNEHLAQSAADLEKTANKWLKPYPNAEWRENVEVFLVAIVVAMAIRTFFLQPFKIPTGSMQPTLFGITVEPLYDPAFHMPGFFARVYDLLVKGAIYHQVIAADDGQVVSVGTTGHFLHFFNKRTIQVRYQNGAEVPITLWFTPDDSASEGPFEERVGLFAHPQFHKGEPIVRFVETTGDHLFVDRLTFNFRRPRRGEIIVFQTKNTPIPEMDRSGQDQFYVKRLIGLPGDTISIGDDDHARINGRRLDASAPHFENLYTFNPNIPAQDSHYHGHVLDSRSQLRTTNDTLIARDKHYLFFGDNTTRSLDSRFWGDVPQENIVGKAWFVYWPITTGSTGRFGWSYGR